MNNEIIQLLNQPFYKRGDFIVGTILALISIIVSLLAWRAARSAKEAATESKKVVQVQSIMLEISDIIQKFDSLREDINFFNARNLVGDISRKINRHLTSLVSNGDTDTTVNSILETLKNISVSLDSVRPIQNQEIFVGSSIYHALEGGFRDLSNQLSVLQGILEKKTVSNN